MKNQIEKIEKVAREVDGRVITDYSGRGMFGKNCYGIVCANINECLEVAGKHGLRNARTDNMGKNYIVYWPHITFDEAMAEG